MGFLVDSLHGHVGAIFGVRGLSAPNLGACKKFEEGAQEREALCNDGKREELKDAADILEPLVGLPIGKATQ